MSSDNATTESLVNEPPSKKFKSSSVSMQIGTMGNNGIVAGGDVNVNVNPQNAEAKIDLSSASIDNIRAETTGFIATTSYKQLDELVRQHKTLILHIHGYPGSGKSEIARKLASNFPFSDPAPDTLIKWHIECSDKSQDVASQLILILKALKERNFLSESHFTTEKDLQNGKSKPFVELIRKAEVPTLVLIEDPQPNDFDLLRDFLRWIDQLGEQMRFPLHVYVTMRKNEFATTRDHLRWLKCYRNHQVDGFTTDEALEMLFGKNASADTNELKSAIEVIEAVSGSPQALIAVKAYCAKTLVSYSQYIKHLMSPELESDVLKIEMYHLKEIYGPNFRHVFKSIELLLKPSSADQDETSMMTWNVMTTLCFLHHGYVPQQLLGRIAQKIYETSESTTEKRHFENTVKSGSVLSELEGYGICKVEEKSNYLNCTLTFHELVFRAVRMSLKTDHESYVENLKKAIFAISGIVHKDLRKSADNIFMNKLAPQISSAINHAKETFEMDKIENISEEFLLHMCLCHLLETVGIVKSLGVLSLKKFAEDALSEAVNTVLKTISRFTGTSFDANFVQYNPNKTVDEVASTAVRAATEAGQSIPPNLLNEYMSLVLQMKIPELEFLEKRTSSPNAVNQVKEATEKHVGLNTMLMTRLRETSDIFLNERTHCAVFFAERLASILHTMGRVLLYYNIQITPEMRKKFMWFSKLSHAISQKCFTQTNIRILFERLTSISMVPIMLKGLNFCPIEEKKSTLLEAHNILENLIQSIEESAAADFYEHGHVKEVQGVYDQMILYRFMIRVKTKLTAMLPDNDNRFLADSEEVYQKLYRLATENISWIMAPKCLVYCGKYDACKQRYAQAVHCFTSAIEAGIKQSNNLFAWASYNYARAVLAGSLMEYYGSAAEKCKEGLESSDDTDEDLVNYLNECLQQLQSLKAQ